VPRVTSFRAYLFGPPIYFSFTILFAYSSQTYWLGKRSTWTPVIPP